MNIYREEIGISCDEFEDMSDPGDRSVRRCALKVNEDPQHVSLDFSPEAGFLPDFAKEPLFDRLPRIHATRRWAKGAGSVVVLGDCGKLSA